MELARECGAALVVAPEGGGVLEHLSSLVSDAGVCLLGSPPVGRGRGGGQMGVLPAVLASRTADAEDVRASPGAASVAAARLGYPVVVKPLDGAGCDGVVLATDDDALEAALRQPALRGAASILVQQYVRRHGGQRVAAGRRRSVDRAQPERAAGARGHPVRLRWRCRLVAHPRRAEACELAQRAVALVSGLQGYVGVDLVLGEETCWLIEINPRLTTSYVGLRRVIDLNMVAAHLARVPGRLAARRGGRSAPRGVRKGVG